MDSMNDKGGLLKLMEIISTKELVQRISIIYYDVKNQNSVINMSEETFAKLFFRRLIYENCLSEYLNIVYQNFSNLKKMFNSSVFESDQFETFLVKVKEKELVLSKLVKKQMIYDQRFADATYDDILQIVEYTRSDLLFSDKD